MKIYSLIILFSISVSCFANAGNDSCKINGIVVDAYNSPISDAMVRFTYFGDIDTVYTNKKGKFCINKSISNPTDFLISHSQFGSARLNDIVFENENNSTLDTVKLVDSQNTQNILYNKIVSKADDLFEAKNYEKAYDLYHRALCFRPQDNSLFSKFNSIEKLDNSITCTEDMFNRIIEAADNYYSNLKYEKALILFERASILRKNDTYSNEMIQKINQLTK
jgi:tetratricopeptide (TPR) repeat protein